MADSAGARIGRFGHLTGREGLDSNNVGQIITGDRDYLWLGTSLGLARIRRAALFSGTFRRSDDAMYAVSGGLRSSQCAPGYPTSSGGSLDSKGRAWIVTSNGLAMIEPGDIRRLDPPPAPQIRAVIVDGKPVVEREALVLASDVRRVEFQYSTVWLSTPERLQYEYRLEGLDADWIPAGTRRATDYNNLPPGQYRFAVRATLGDGGSGPVTTVAFTRRASWLEAQWFPWPRWPVWSRWDGGSTGSGCARSARDSGWSSKSGRGSRANCTTRWRRISSVSRRSSTASPACCASRQRWPKSGWRWRGGWRSTA